MYCSPLLTLYLPFPSSKIPPQSPLFLEPAAFFEVNTIGLVAVPIAFNLAPLVTIKAVEATLLLIKVPAGIVNVALFLTKIVPLNS